MAEQPRRERLRREMIDEIIGTAAAPGKGRPRRNLGAGYRTSGGCDRSRDLPLLPEPGRSNSTKSAIWDSAPNPGGRTRDALDKEGIRLQAAENPAVELVVLDRLVNGVQVHRLEVALNPLDRHRVVNAARAAGQVVDVGGVQAEF